MTAIVLPDIDRSTVEELRKRIPDLSEIELPAMPSMEKVGRNADETIDRLLGRKRAPVWPWIAAGIGLVAVLGMIAAWFAWFRRPGWDGASDTWTATSAPIDASEGATIADATDAAAAPGSSTGSGLGLTAAESSLRSTSYPDEEA